MTMTTNLISWENPLGKHPLIDIFLTEIDSYKKLKELKKKYKHDHKFVKEIDEAIQEEVLNKLKRANYTME